MATKLYKLHCVTSFMYCNIAGEFTLCSNCCVQHLEVTLRQTVLKLKQFQLRLISCLPCPQFLAVYLSAANPVDPGSSCLSSECCTHMQKSQKSNFDFV